MIDDLFTAIDGSLWARPCRLRNPCGELRREPVDGVMRFAMRIPLACGSGSDGSGRDLHPTTAYGARNVVWQFESIEPFSSAPVRMAVAFAMPLPGMR